MALKEKPSEAEYLRTRIRQERINKVGDILVKAVLAELQIETARLSDDGGSIYGVPVVKAPDVIDILSHFNWPFRVVKRHEGVTEGFIDLTL